MSCVPTLGHKVPEIGLIETTGFGLIVKLKVCCSIVHGVPRGLLVATVIVTILPKSEDTGV